MKKVVICQHRLLHYRVGLFERLRACCAQRGINLELVHGQASRREAVKRDEGSLSWANKVKNRFWELGERDFVWQPFPPALRDADLIVVMQESRILSNYLLLLSRLWSHHRVAYWGHGVNFQSNAPDGLREKWKQFMLKRVDWWFAYTEITAEIVAKTGFPETQITCLNNAIDTTTFKSDLAAVQDTDLLSAKMALGISPSAPVAIYCGSLYPDKRLGFLVDACDRIRIKTPEFHCIVLGDGPSMPFLRDARKSRPWLHLLGVAQGAKKALYFRMANFMLNPGSVGLHVVDAFCAGLVMVTTRGARHGPEICYLRNGVNGIITSDSTADYAERVLAIVRDPVSLTQIRAASLADANVYTLENMVERFANGIENCLGMLPNK